jgi:hypothetical protein
MKTEETNAPTNNVEKIFKVNGDWQVQSNKLKIKFPFLTDGDLQMEVGKENEMLKRVEARLHLNRTEVMDIMAKNEAEINSGN